MSNVSMDIARDIANTVFSNTYFEARQKFVAAATGSREYPCSVGGPEGEALFTDAAYFGDPKAKRLLVLVSGVHGPEGFCGSAGQLAFLGARMHQQLPDSTAVLFVHALNCYGFAWDRKVTAEGVDLNRNFVDFSKGLPPNPGFEEIAELVNPPDISPEFLEVVEARIAEYRARHGELKFQEARSSGQYTRPGCMFYGGSGPSEARRTLERIVADFDVASRDNVTIIDYHTGLGPYGYGELQCEQPSGLSGYQRAARIFGSTVTSPDLGTSSSVLIKGCQDEYWQRLLAERHTYVALEFGTFDLEFARRARRDDLWLFKYGKDQVHSDLGKKIRAASKLHAYPQKLDWQEMVVWRSHQVCRQALEAFEPGD